MLAAVVGTGIYGLAAIKSLLEEGIDVLVFEQRGTVGGTWVLDDDPHATTVISLTRCNFSKQRMCFSDYPHLPSTDSHPTHLQIAAYLQSYAEHFQILPHVKFNTVVVSVDLLPKSGSEDADKYQVEYKTSGEETKTLVVDKVFITVGALSQPFIPEIKGIEEFGGAVMHSQAYKSGTPFVGKNVVVVGSRSSAADICTSLVQAGAKKVYMSHRGGLLVMPRMIRGKPYDHLVSFRTMMLGGLIERFFPSFGGWLTHACCSLISRCNFKFDKSWGFDPPPYVGFSVPTITDHLVPMLQAGQITSVPMIASIDPSTPTPTSLTLTDKTHLPSIDAIIFATGYSKPSISTLLGPNIRARLQPPPAYQKLLPTDLPLDQLQYKFVLSPGLPSLCVNNGTFAPDGTPILVELKSLYVAGVWSGKIPLASEEERWKGSLEDYKWLKAMQKRGPVTNGAMPYIKTVMFYSDAIGSPLHTHLKWFSIQSWRWWLSKGNWGLGRLLMDGVMSPHAFRLGGRKAWEGAEGAIREANGITGGGVGGSK